MTDLLVKGNFVKFTDTENGAEYSFVARVDVVDTKANIVHLTAEKPYGDIGVSLDLASKFSQAKTPKNMSAFKAVKPAKKVVVPVAKVIKTKAAVTGSKKELAIALYDATKSRAENIAVFVKELNMTTAGASTYVAMAKKTIG